MLPGEGDAAEEAEAADVTDSKREEEETRDLVERGLGVHLWTMLLLLLPPAIRSWLPPGTLSSPPPSPKGGRTARST